MGQNRDFCQIWTVFCAVCHQLPFKNSHSYEKVYQTENVTSISRNSFGRNEFSVQTILMQFYGKKPRNLQKWSKITVFGMPHSCAWRYKKIHETENVEFTWTNIFAFLQFFVRKIFAPFFCKKPKNHTKSQILGKRLGILGI